MQSEFIHNDSDGDGIGIGASGSDVSKKTDVTSNIKKKILLCGAHPNNSTGYANVVYNLARHIKDQCELIIFAFDAKSVCLDRAESLRVKIISPERINGQRFGEGLLESTIMKERPDVIILYNDILVVSALLKNITEIKIPKWVYIDFVYEWQDLDIINYILEQTDHIFTFTPFWKNHLLEMAPRYPKENISILYHGLKPVRTFSKSEKVQLTKKFFPDIDETATIILNLNRNTARKRIDLTIRAFLTLLKKNNMPTDLFLFLAGYNNETYNIAQLIKVESFRLKLDQSLVEAQILKKPNDSPNLTDLEVDFLYYRCDIGLNTCSGEGFGLCNFEHASYNRPQVVPFVGGFQDILKGARFVYPTDDAHVAYEATLGIVYQYQTVDFVNNLNLYYRNKERRIRDGVAIGQYVRSDMFNWKNISDLFLRG